MSWGSDWCKKEYPGHSIHKYWDPWDPKETEKYFGVELNLSHPEERDLVVVFYEEKAMAAKKATTKKAAKKETAMTVEKNLPDPTKGQAAWVSAMVDSGIINMRDYRDYSGKDKRLWMVEGARRVSAGLHSKLLEVELTAIGEERVNCFKASDDCKAFWKNGREQNMTEEQILEGWLAMMSMQEDVGPKA
jgi:hypothetical protein